MIDNMKTLEQAWDILLKRDHSKLLNDLARELEKITYLPRKNAIDFLQSKSERPDSSPTLSKKKKPLVFRVGSQKFGDQYQPQEKVYREFFEWFVNTVSSEAISKISIESRTLNRDKNALNPNKSQKIQVKPIDNGNWYLYMSVGLNAKKTNIKRACQIAGLPSPVFK